MLPEFVRSGLYFFACLVNCLHVSRAWQNGCMVMFFNLEKIDFTCQLPLSFSRTVYTSGFFLKLKVN